MASNVLTPLLSTQGLTFSIIVTDPPRGRSLRRLEGRARSLGDSEWKQLLLEESSAMDAAPKPDCLALLLQEPGQRRKGGFLAGGRL
ncbi:UNVERIFIED_CONTAM: hypothetical protein K2H54_007984 [Gekko kuhli]